MGVALSPILRGHHYDARRKADVKKEHHHLNVVGKRRGRDCGLAHIAQHYNVRRTYGRAQKILQRYRSDNRKKGFIKRAALALFVNSSFHSRSKHKRAGGFCQGAFLDMPYA